MKIHFLVLHIILWVTLMHDCFAQNISSSYSELGFQVGVARILNKDTFQSPFTYRGNSLLTQVAYLKSKAAGQHHLVFSYARGSMQSVVSSPARNQVFLLNYDYLIRLKPTFRQDKFSWYVGGGLHSVAYTVNYHPDIEAPITYLSGSSALTLSGKLVYSINNQGALTLQAAIPLIGMMLRPDFEVNGNTYTQLSYFGKNTWVAARIEYAHKLGNTYRAMLSYQTDYFTSQDPKLLRVMRQEISLGIKKVF